MPLKSKEQVRFYIANIRKLMAIDHNMPLREIQVQLEENNIHMQLNYIGLFRNKILNEQASRIDRKLLSPSFAILEDALIETTRVAWQIALSNASTRKERIAALREIRQAHNDVFNKLFVTKVFERKEKEGELDQRYISPLTLEQVSDMIETLIPWGIVKENEIHAQLPAPKPADLDSKPS